MPFEANWGEQYAKNASEEHASEPLERKGLTERTALRIFAVFTRNPAVSAPRLLPGNGTGPRGSRAASSQQSRRLRFAFFPVFHCAPRWANYRQTNVRKKRGAGRPAWVVSQVSESRRPGAPSVCGLPPNQSDVCGDEWQAL